MAKKKRAKSHDKWGAKSWDKRHKKGRKKKKSSKKRTHHEEFEVHLKFKHKKR